MLRCCRCRREGIATPARTRTPACFHTQTSSAPSFPLPKHQLAISLCLPAVAPQHAKFTQKGRQLFLTALVGESVFDSSSTWIDGEEARPNVAYVLSVGSSLAFGSQGGGGGASEGPGAGGSLRVEFEEPSGSNPLVEMLLQGAAAGASAEVQQALSDASSEK
jgi:hypothetical protein